MDFKVKHYVAGQDVSVNFTSFIGMRWKLVCSFRVYIVHIFLKMGVIDRFVPVIGDYRPYSRCQILKPSLVFSNRASYGR